jgi:hypothetical protein
MSVINNIFGWALKKRIHQIDLFEKYPIDVQNEVLSNLLETAQNTDFGKNHDFKSIKSYQDFANRVPAVTYEELYPSIERLLKGEKNLLWPGEVNWFAKSSGTTNAKSKFIPVSREALEDCHYKGGKDMLSLYFNNFNQRDLFDGKCLSIGGSHQINPLNPKSHYGDVSAVIMQNLPIWAKWHRTPSIEIATMENWEQKIDAMVKECVSENVTCMAGVPTWTLILLKRILEIENKSNILEVWPNLELFMHGAVSFGPYRQLFNEIIPSNQMSYQDIYNASEGFFGIQNDPNSDDLLLMLDYGVYYEFSPTDSPEKIIPLSDVELNKNYALIISTNAGLWRYKIGDTVRFTSLLPYKIKISGRTKHFINAFGEELMVENADQAIKYASEKTNCLISNYTACPIYFEGNNGAGHEWLIEFEKGPCDIEQFTYLLDQKLKEVNSDYEAKRHKDLALRMPLIKTMPQGTFYRWLESKNKLGGQYKVPRLANNREYVDEILRLM